MTKNNSKPNGSPLTAYERTKRELKKSPKRWLVTGVAGFIGSHLLEALLQLDQEVCGLDNFATGKPRNLDEIKARVSSEQWSRFTFHNADICDLPACLKSCQGVDYVLHQAALGSVPRSLANPIATNHSNVDGFLNILWAAKSAGVKRFVYASSSSVYGDHPQLPKVEAQIGDSLSPYALSKRMNELQAQVFARCYGVESIGLRYFNVFGPRQDPEGAYAAVIPKWIAAMIEMQDVEINGDGETSRDFCFVENVVQANLLAATVGTADAVNQAYNISVGGRTTLTELYQKLRSRLGRRFTHLKNARPVHRDFRAGDVRHSHADISKARSLLGYEPTHDVEQGLDEALGWYVENLVPGGRDGGLAREPAAMSAAEKE
jgi:UDP-N-acetylglucosamine 4-epimerase